MCIYSHMKWNIEIKLIKSNLFITKVDYLVFRKKNSTKLRYGHFICPLCDLNIIVSLSCLFRVYKIISLIIGKAIQFSNPFPYPGCYIFAVKISSCLQYLISQHCSFVYHFCIQSTKGKIIAQPFYVEIKSWMYFRKKGGTRQCGVEKLKPWNYILLSNLNLFVDEKFDSIRQVLYFNS